MDEDKRKHLDMIQAIITRMAGNSFLLKGWSVTVGSGLIALAAGTKHPWVAVVALLPSAVFWALDAYYLAVERRYRALFAAVADRQTDPGAPAGRWEYSLDPSTYEKTNTWGDAASSATVYAIPLAVMVSVGAVCLVMALSPAEKAETTRVMIRDTVNVRTVLPPPPRPAVPSKGAL